MNKLTLPLLVGCLFCAATAGADAPDAGLLTTLDHELDAVIDRLIRDEDLDGGIHRLQELVRQRNAIRATSVGARKAAREQQQAWLDRRDAWLTSSDGEVAWRCRLSSDPANAPRPDGWPGDWGTVTRKEELQMPGRNALAEPSHWTLYEVRGQKATYRFRGESFGLSNRSREPFRAEPGDLALVCHGAADREPRLPPSWQEDYLSTGFAVRLNRPPKVADKKKWNPLHISSTDLFWAIRDARWKYPADGYVLAGVEVVRPAGDNLFEMDSIQNERYLLDVPPGLAHRDLLVPGRNLWAIMGNARFDTTLHRLVLTAEDLEPSYIDEKRSDDKRAEENHR